MAPCRIAAVRLSSSDDELPSAFDLSAELAKRSQSKSLRLRTSGPVRKTFGALADAVGEASAFINANAVYKECIDKMQYL